MRQQLRRGVITGNVIGYAGMLATIVIYLCDLTTHPLLYGLSGAAVGSGTGLAYLSLWRLRELKPNPRGESANDS